MHTQDRR